MTGSRPEPLASTVGDLAALIVEPGELEGRAATQAEASRRLRADGSVSPEWRLSAASAFLERSQPWA